LDLLDAIRTLSSSPFAPVGKVDTRRRLPHKTIICYCCQPATPARNLPFPLRITSHILQLASLAYHLCVGARPNPHPFRQASEHHTPTPIHDGEVTNLAFAGAFILQGISVEAAADTIEQITEASHGLYILSRLPEFDGMVSKRSRHPSQHRFDAHTVKAAINQSLWQWGLRQAAHQQ